MCGIAGTVGYYEDAIEKMVMHQRQRGPDNMAIWNEPLEKLWLGHNRLSIIDLSSAGNQPMHTNRYTLVYNGEIYNYREMQTYLDSHDDSGTYAITGNDTRTLLRYIERFGLERALQDANGMYAYCCYDAKLKQIHLVTDRFGQKPLYYCHSGAKFAFASSVGAILTLNDKWKIDEEGLASYWLLGACMGEYTMISDIKKLTGSHHLMYDLREKTVKIERYWVPKFQENTSGIEDLVLDAINKVKVADVQPFVFLSGGIDSTLVASQFKNGAAVHLNSPEIDYAWQVREKFNLNMSVVDPQNVDVVESLKDYAFQVGEPSMAALIPYITSKEVSKFAKVAISANAADELFFGYDRTKQDVQYKQLEHIFRQRFGRDFDNWDWQHDFLKPILADPFDYPDERISTGRWLELISYVQFDLNRTLDGAAMCHSLEVRSPFLDHRLVEMALSIPEAKHRDRELGNKAILKRMLLKMGFHKEFVTRPKLGFSLHKEPRGMQELKDQAWAFVKNNRFLKCNDKALTGRDKKYLEMAALSFWVWYQTWEHKL